MPGPFPEKGEQASEGPEKLQTCPLGPAQGRKTGGISPGKLKIGKEYGAKTYPRDSGHRRGCFGSSPTPRAGRQND
jgi:hypothetical protein